MLCIVKQFVLKVCAPFYFYSVLYRVHLIIAFLFSNLVEMQTFTLWMIFLYHYLCLFVFMVNLKDKILM